MAAPAASQAAIERAICAAKSQGLAVASFSVARDGTVIVQIAATLDTEGQNMQPATPKKWAKR